MKSVGHILLYIFAICTLTACTNTPGNKKYDPQKVNFNVLLNPLFDSQLYPSLILGLNSTTASPQGTEAAQQLYTFSVTVTAPSDNALLRVIVDSSIFNYVTTFEEILPHKGDTYTFYPPLNWKYDRLATLRQSRPIDLAFTCFVNDEQIITRNLHLNLRTVNECPLSFQHGSRHVDTRWLFAAFVNEDHPYIEQILSDILSQGIVSRISGYQNGSKAAREQAFAVWYYALNRGIAYSSISCTSNPSPSTNVQHIRFFDQVFNSRQANCIDACVFFASILRKIGLRPVIFVEPCHAYLGYYTDKTKNAKIELLETTITAWVNFPELEKSLDEAGRLPDEQLEKISKYLSQKQLDEYKDGKMTFEQLKIAVARSLFSQANKYDLETYTNNKYKFENPDSLSYQQLDIEKLRQLVRPLYSE
jgi:hypothetical protein